MNPESIDILIFEVDGQYHGVRAADVQELLPALALAPLPGAPAGVAGVINLRGVIVPVLDVRTRFGMPARKLALTDHFIVVRHQDRQTALHVDRAHALATLLPAAVAEIETAGPGSTRTQVAKWQDALVMLHAVRDLLGNAGVEATP